MSSGDWLMPRADAAPPRENAGPVMMWITGTLMFFVLLTTSFRIFIRVRNRAFGWDDGTILVCVAICIARLAVQIKQLQNGNGQHKVYLTAHQYTKINMYGWQAQIYLFAAVAMLKTSICLLILRIKNTKAWKIGVYTVMAGVLFTNFGVVVILLAECKPAGFWRGKSAKCWPTKIRIYSIYACIAYSVVTDLVLSLLPPVIVWKVKIPTRDKIMVCSLMSLGLVASGFGIARAASLGIVTTDLSWVYCITAIWSNLELFLGVICANLALARSVYVYFFKNNIDSQLQGSYYNSARSGNGYGNASGGGSRLRGDRVNVMDSVVESRNMGGRDRRGSDGRSSKSDILLVEGIQKKTEFWVGEEATIGGKSQTNSEVGSKKERVYK